jgi:hypothetical protein
MAVCTVVPHNHLFDTLSLGLSVALTGENLLYRFVGVLLGVIAARTSPMKRSRLLRASTSDVQVGEMGKLEAVIRRV